jgi:hypothetical protein
MVAESTVRAVDCIRGGMVCVLFGTLEAVPPDSGCE